MPALRISGLSWETSRAGPNAPQIEIARPVSGRGRGEPVGIEQGSVLDADLEDVVPEVFDRVE